MRPRVAGSVLCCLLVLLAGVRAATAGAGEAPEVQVIYLANEGFLLEAGETKVLVDALFGEGLRGYPVVPAPIRAELEGARGRFAGVDLILASHFHGDHFDAAAVARHLRANPGAVFLSTD
ncbi:MAG: MBL fold metallo-hydrolase, partial [Thermoanaerobaculia bacterium]